MTKLTAMSIHSIKAVGFTHDDATPGLYVKVMPFKHGGGFSRSWAFRYNSPATDARRWLGMGPVSRISLAEARKLANDYWKMVYVERRDPIDEQKNAKVAALKERAKALTFEQACKGFLRQHGGTWKNDKHAKQWRSTLDRACAAFGKLPVAQIDEAIITNMLAPIWEVTPETGSRLRGRVERVLDWAIVGKFRDGPNPARWDGHLEHLLKRKPKAKHHAAMPWIKLPEFMQDLRGKESLSARALEFTILTAGRTGEVIGAKWNEFDLQTKVWTVPASRMKAGQEHQVPLCGRAVEILNELAMVKHKDTDLIFGLSNMAMLQMLRGISPNGFTVHGFRSTFRDWAGESTNFTRELIEHALAHGIPNKTERAYRRETAVTKRRSLMAAWCRHCSSAPMPASAEVVRLRA
jgi:integrase